MKPVTSRLKIVRNIVEFSGDALEERPYNICMKRGDIVNDQLSMLNFHLDMSLADAINLILERELKS